MVDFQYLYRGLCGLARAHRAGVMAGHLGAAVTAGYFFGENLPKLDRRVHDAVERELERIIGGEETVWFDPKKAGISVRELFEPFPDERPREPLMDTLPAALAETTDKTRQSGHNVIFASIAIRGLRDHPRYATPGIVTGIRRLIAGFAQAGPGRGYYGKKRGWIAGDEVQLPDDPEFPVYRDLKTMVQVVIDDLIRWGSGRRRGFGGLPTRLTGHGIPGFGTVSQPVLEQQRRRR